MNSGQEVASQLIVSGGYAPEVLEPAEAAFDNLSAFVGTFVEAMDDDTIGFIGITGLAPRLTIRRESRRAADFLIVPPPFRPEAQR